MLVFEKMFLLIQILVQAASATDYCKICENGTHTMCQFNEGPAVGCIDYVKVDISDDVKKYIVDIHNDIRNHVASGRETKGHLGKQPPAADMSQLEWDEELSAMAQRWADQCVKMNATLQHDVCRKSDRFDVGQNILTAITSDSRLPELANLILTWYKQVADVIPADIKYFSGMHRGKYLIGQYTQLVWSRTKYVGCGLSIFRESKKSPLYNQRLVCNYGPAGNVIGLPIYQIGRPCSGCPSKECDRFKESLCRGSRGEPPSKLPFNLTLKKFMAKESDNLFCILISDETQNTLDKCQITSNDIPDRNGSELLTTAPSVNKSTIPMDLRDGSEKLLKSPQLKNSLGAPDRDMNLKKSVQNIKATHEGVSKSVPIEDAGKRSGNGYGECMKPFGHIQKNARKFEQNKIRPVFLNEEVVFPNKVRFRRERGKWQDGHCRCNRIYRSSCYTYKSESTLLFLLTIVTNTFK